MIKETEVVSMNAATDTPGAARAVGGEPEATPKRDIRKFIVVTLFVLAIFIAAFFLGGMMISDGNSQSDEDKAAVEAREDKAAAVIQARYIDDDMNATLTEPVTVSINDNGEFIGTWSQINEGATQPMQCTTPLLVSEDEQMFGFDPIPELTPREARNAPAKCTSHPGLDIGLTMPEESSPVEGDS